MRTNNNHHTVHNKLCSVSFRYSIVLAVWTVGSSLAQAQQVDAQARVDSARVLIGDWINLTVEVEHPDNVTLIWPQMADVVKPLEIIRQEPPTTAHTGMRVLERARWTLAAYDSGFFIIPSIQIPYTRANDTTKYSVTTSPITIFVRGVAIDTTQDIKDIKAPLPVPITFAEILPYVLVVAGVGGLIWLVYFLLKKRQRGESILPPPPPRPAHETALDALRTLEAERLWQRGKVKEYHSQLTDILRTYIENRFGIMALEMTTAEILRALTAMVQRESLPRESHSEQNSRSPLPALKEILVRADLVKFAKFLPLPEEHERSMSLAYSFVLTTKSVAPDEKPEGTLRESQMVTP